MGADFIADTRNALSHREAVTTEDHSLVPAAVLLAIHEVDGELCLVLQKRSEQVEHHKGEISFPGGAVDPEDESYLGAALRESNEEMGILPEDVEVLGRLDDTPTTSAFMISTFVGSIPSPYRFRPSKLEVAEVLTVPISHLRNQEFVREEVRLDGGDLVSMPCYSYEGNVIFGATARILGQFLELTADAPL